MPATFTQCLAFCSGLALLGGCLLDADGNGRRVNEIRNVSDFTRVDLEGSFDVAIEQGDEITVKVSIDSNLVDLINTRVVDGTLELDSDRPIGNTVSGPHVIVTMPTVRRAGLSGSGVLSLTGIDTEDPLSLDLDGSGDVHFEGTLNELSVRVEGSGDVDLEGDAEHVSLRLDGSGEIDARRLQAQTGKLDLRGSGNIRATVQDTVEVNLEGSGDIDLFGGAKVSDSSIEGSGDFHQHAL